MRSFKNSVIDEIKRIYQETQYYLDNLFSDNETNYLYRVLNHRQEVQFFNRQKISYISFHLSSRQIDLVSVVEMLSYGYQLIKKIF